MMQTQQHLTMPTPATIRQEPQQSSSYYDLNRIPDEQAVPVPAIYNSHPSIREPSPFFTITLLSPPHPAILKLSCFTFHPFHQWLPWCSWDQQWLETHPMQTTLRCPVNKIEETRYILTSKGFKQTRVRERKRIEHRPIHHTVTPYSRHSHSILIALISDLSSNTIYHSLSSVCVSVYRIC